MKIGCLMTIFTCTLSCVAFFLSFFLFLLYIIICISNSLIFLNLCSFLQRVVDSLVSLLKSGADREPEILEQVQFMVYINFFTIIVIITYINYYYYYYR